MVNEERIYKYRQLFDGLNNSIIAYIDHYIAVGKKYQTLENFSIRQSYTLLAKGESGWAFSQ